MSSRIDTLRLLGIALLAGLAGGYAFRLWVGEWKPPPPRVVPDEPEWIPGEYAGYPNAYNVRPLE